MGNGGYYEETADDDITIIDDDWSTIDDDETVCDSNDGLTKDEEILYNNECRAMVRLQSELRSIFRGNAYNRYIHPIVYNY